MSNAPRGGGGKVDQKGTEIKEIVAVCKHAMIIIVSGYFPQIGALDASDDIPPS